MTVFFILFFAFIIISIVKSESDRKKKHSAAVQQEAAQQEVRFNVPEPSVKPQKDDAYYGEDVPRTTRAAVSEEKAKSELKLDFDPEKMIIYSEILKPKF